MTDQEIEIEILDEQPEETSTMQLPVNFLTFGEIESTDVKVYIKQSTYKALEKLAASDTSKELGSILIGEYSQDMGKTHVVISDYVEAKYTDASASTLTFTHDTWHYVHKEHEKRFPDKKIIGWQHTHPNYGIFLSNYDMFIQENFFNMPFQIAYVIDPVQNLRGFFQWKDGKIEKLKGYYIYDDTGKPIKIEQTKKKPEQAKQPAKRSPWVAVLLALLCVVTVILSVSVISLNRQLKAQQETMQTSMNAQNTIIADQALTIAQLQVHLGDSQTTVEELLAMIEENRVTIENQEATIQQLQALAGSEDDGTVRFVAYTVEAGDSLSGICAKQGIDYPANKRIIMAINGITNDSLIYVGQTILLPVYP